MSHECYTICLNCVSFKNSLDFGNSGTKFLSSVFASLIIVFKRGRKHTGRKEAIQIQINQIEDFVACSSLIKTTGLNIISLNYRHGHLSTMVMPKIQPLFCKYLSKLIFIWRPLVIRTPCLMLVDVCFGQ